jgi:EpsI family protein
MEKIKTRYLLVIGLLTVFGVMQGGSGYSSYIKGDNENPLKDFPLEVGEWSGKQYKMKEDVFQILETNAVILNAYKRGTDLVAQSIVHYSNERVDFHSPESCNVGRGDKVEGKKINSIILNSGEREIPIKVKSFIVKRNKKSRKLIYYFFKSEKFIGPNYLNFRYNLGLNFLRNRKTSGSLIILSTPVINDISSSESTLKIFMESFYPVWTKYL